MSKSVARSHARRATSERPGGPRASTTNPAPEDAVAGATIKVRATQVGYYGDARRRVGDVFRLYPREGTFTELAVDKDGKPEMTQMLIGGTMVPTQATREVLKTLTAEEQFSDSWMERVDDDVEEGALTTGLQDLRRKHDEARASGRPTGSASPLGDD